MDGVVYVADSWNHRIQCFTSDGVFIRKWGKNGHAQGEFEDPAGIATGTGRRTDNKVINYMSLIAELAAFPPGVLPICAEYAGEECVIVADSGNHRIQVFDTGGSFLRTWGRKGEFGDDGPSSCAIGPDGVVYIGSSYSDVQSFEVDGTFLRKLDVTEICTPSCISVDAANNNLYIVDTRIRCIVCYDTDWKLKWKMELTENFDRCDGILAHGEAIYIADEPGHSIWRLCIPKDSSPFPVVHKWKKDSTRVRIAGIPHGMAKGPNGILYVADSKNDQIVMVSVPH